MFSSELTIAIRNILLVQLLVIMVPGHPVPVCRQLLNIWKLVTSSEPKKETRKKPNKFWEIDMTKFEP